MISKFSLGLFSDSRKLITKVVKTGPDRPVGPVEPGIGPESGPVDAQKRSANEPAKNRQNRI
jgi:hypothetical protein